MLTPYGESVDVSDLGSGVKHVSGLFHGGYFITNTLAKNTIPRVRLEAAAVRMGNYWFFEETHAWAVLALSIPKPFGQAGYSTLSKSLNHFADIFMEETE